MHCFTALIIHYASLGNAGLTLYARGVHTVHALHGSILSKSLHMVENCFALEIPKATGLQCLQRSSSHVDSRKYLTDAVAAAMRYC